MNSRASAGRLVIVVVLCAAAGMVVAVLAVSALLGGAGAASPSDQSWRPDGLSGTLVHSVFVARRGMVYAGTDNGLFVRRGGPWHQRIRAQELWSVSGSPSGSLVAAAADSGKLFLSTDRGRRWKTSLTTPGAAYAVFVDPHAPRRILVGAGGVIELSRDRGLNWMKVALLGNSACDAFAWIGRNTVLAGLVSGGGVQPLPYPVLISRDAGRTWRNFGSGLPQAGVMSLLPTSRRLLAGTMGHAVWSYRPGHGRWRSSRGSMPPTGDHGAALLTVPGHRHTVYVGTLGFGVYKSDNAGATWRPFSTGLSSLRSRIILSLAYDAGSRSLLAGTDGGVYAISLPLTSRHP